MDDVGYWDAQYDLIRDEVEERGWDGLRDLYIGDKLYWMMGSESGGAEYALYDAAWAPGLPRLLERKLFILFLLDRFLLYLKSTGNANMDLKVGRKVAREARRLWERKKKARFALQSVTSEGDDSSPQ